MKSITWLILFALLAGKLYAQTPAKSKPLLPPPLPFREVSGIVKDTSDNTVIGATVTLTSAKDTLRTATNARGIFVFKNVKQSVFFINIKGVGYAAVNRRFLYGDTDKKLILDPFVLGPDAKFLKEVNINGTAPIVFKEDTVEYRAANYKVRENATVDELLRKMPNVEVDKNGKVTFQGQEIKKARVNGKDFNGGDVAQAVKNLPADIVDRAQFVDDYGTQAARTGIKDGDPTKVLNITTKPDRSVGNMARLTATGGNNDRYEGQAYLQRLNANQQIGINGNFSQTVLGVGSGGGLSAGSSTNGRPSINYRDQFGKKLQFNSSYNYNYSSSDQSNNSDGQTFSSNGTTNFNNQSTSQGRNNSHNLSMEVEYTFDKANFLQVSSSVSHSISNNSNTSAQTLTGFQNQYQNSAGVALNTGNNYNVSVVYQHLFKNPAKNISLQLSSTGSNQQSKRESNTETLYRDSLQNQKLDSLSHLIVARGNLNKNYTANLTYSQPVTKTAQINFNAVVNYRSYNNTALTDSINKGGVVFPVPSLSDIFTYSFTEARIALNYRINTKKYNLAVGITGIPTLLEGTKVSLNSTTSHHNFNLIPLARITYNFSKTQKVSVNYSGSPSEPTFTQIQPVIDKSNPQNVIVGNPDLKPSFRHSINFQYDNYIPNSKLFLSLSSNDGFVNNQVVTNTIQVPIPALNSFYNENHFLNLNGTYNMNVNHGVTKVFVEQKYNLRLGGSFSYNNNISMSNNIQYHSSSWHMNEDIGPRLNPNDWLEINPSVSYAIARSFFTQPNAINTDTKTTALKIDGTFTFLKSWRLGYNASKNYVEGISANLTHNPFVIDAFIDKTLFKKRNGTLKVQAFDLLNQNNFVDQVVSNTSVTNTKTNVFSRYVLVSFSINLQKWSGAPKRNGVIMLRRGDGSFIY